MKKTNIFVLLVIVLLSLSIIGCTGAAGNPLDLVGKWTRDISATSTGTFDFKSDGTYTYTDSGVPGNNETGTYVGGEYNGSFRTITWYRTTGQSNSLYVITYGVFGAKTYLCFYSNGSTLPATTRFTKQ
jgi:hypothetical protein